MHALHWLWFLLPSEVTLRSPTTSGTELGDSAHYVLDVQRGMSPAEPVRYWEKTSECHVEFVRANEANIEEPDFGGWYAQTMADMAKKNSNAYKNLSEIVLFAELAAGIADLKCTMTTGIRQSQASYKEIVNHIQAQIITKDGYWGA